MKQPKIFQLQTTPEFNENLLRTIKQQDDNPTRSEMVKRLVRYAAKTGLKVPPTEENA